ncbi:hypothetical protein GGR55DRAFT_693543 [Xylaria sp. FL0064]|nr:hypothetical protein GGR55DRAFT_693543 [Xylaria sp. FL0064]
MLSLSSLLNPAPTGPSNGIGLPPSPESSSPTDSCGEESVFPERSAIPKHKMPKDAAVFTKSKPKGAINFPPYEKLDDLSLHKTRIFQVYPLGRIREFSRHIPYNSGKKGFFEKTGRESFEVFQYVFKVPTDDTEYTVMWDYNVGLVRMTPFFKCCKYPKTTPAKMLNLNPGLKEISHSITGGSIIAQGYWMPYQCAKAVCATFCYNIAGALIPIFGPEFPAFCKQVDAPDYSRMVIDPAIVLQSRREAEYYRRFYGNSTVSMSTGSRNDNGSIVTPKRDYQGASPPYDDSNKSLYRSCPRKLCVSTPGSEDNNSHTTDTERVISPAADRPNLDRDRPYPQITRYLHSSIPSIVALPRPGHVSSKSSGWTPANASLHTPAHLHPCNDYRTAGPSPWLSAIPRSTTTADLRTLPYPDTNAFRVSRSWSRYPYDHPWSQSQSQSRVQCHPQISYHRHTSSAHEPQLPPPSEQPQSQQASPSSPQSPRAAKRPAAYMEDDNADYLRHRTTTAPRHSYQQEQRLSRQYYTNNENHVANGSIHVVTTATGDDKRTMANTTMATDNKAALLLLNLSAQELGRKEPLNNEDGQTITSRMDGNRRHAGSRCAGNPEGGGGGDGGKHIARGGGAANVGSDEVSSVSPLYDVFPRIKRARSHTM